MPESGPQFAPDEIVTSAPTRSARLKWVVVIDEDLAPGLAANAVACVAASTGASVAGLVAHGGPDGSGSEHPGLPWAGCSVLRASGEALLAVRAKAAASDGVLAVDMPASAQAHRVYDDYLAELATTEPADLRLGALSLVGPRNRVDKLVKGLPLA